jgi:uncharacterized SAM-binding protein YcdF (DUF218 family)
VSIFSSHKTSGRLLAILLLLAVGYIAFVAASIWSYGTRDETVKADAAIVLGAGTDGIEPSPVFQQRIDHAIWLYRNEYVDKLILTGGMIDGAQRSDAAIAREYAIFNGVSDNDILIEELSTITQENLLYSKSIMADNAFSTVLLVSDPLHMKRAMQVAKDCGIEAYSSPTRKWAICLLPAALWTRPRRSLA